ncbi:hypothetical protein XENOCAPTIV_015681 [Xenoophorus captivus]|uniref:Uncharacterized protein n=1 Tax=Xenoophorus captivus TaxID=1517983 RepID=A0ABV0QD39_9TELE
MSHLRNKEREEAQQSFNPLPPTLHAPTHPTHKKKSNHTVLYSCTSPHKAPYSSRRPIAIPQLPPARNLTVRNLSARRLKPEECYCSGHSCTSTGPASAATVCEEGEGVRRVVMRRKKGGRNRRCEKGYFYVFPALCCLMTKQQIVDSKLTHSS